MTLMIATLSFFIDTPLPLSPDKFVLGIVSPLPCSSRFVCHILLFVYFLKEVISFVGSLDKCHTSFFNALIETKWNKEKNACPFPNKPWFLRVCNGRLLKTLQEKKKLLVTSIFSFSPQCFLSICRTFCHFHQI